MISPHRDRRHVWISIFVLACLVATLGCQATRGRRGTPEEAGFLGDYSQLAPREGYEAQLVYVNPGADWSRYTAVHLDSVTLWADKDTAKLSKEDQQMLTDTLYKALHEKLGEQFQLVERPGPNVLRMRAALTQAKGSNIPLRTMTTIIPQIMLVGTAVGLSADTAVTVGTATVEAELLDSVTRERLAAAVDQRAGTKSLFTTRTFKTWGDVEAACQHWAERVTAFLVREGVHRRPGAVEIDG